MTTPTNDAANILTTTAEHELSVLVFYRGHWCPFCQSYLKELNGDFRSQVEAIGGRMIGITSQSDELATEVQEAWGLGFDVISDPSTELAKSFGIHITAKAETPMAEHPTEYPNGMSQTGVIVLTRSGEVIYNWAVDPTETNLFGSSDRPLPNDVWAAIEAHRNGTEVAPGDGRLLDLDFLAENYPEQHADVQAFLASQKA